ncbi:TIGR00266 family protein [Sedimentibacter sp. zth1]|uniref:TIGR00266 family protein n=1 Tax=Sedimentibacter sp. zth1 TaxID=2816908 RepID=UPI001A90CE9B|nr:TIGR00266 family protein [Sedimentibacter sp. zth1]QSX06766.1 TIGR00266 family protein [Sedimentibacter sp. zth1]
MKYNILGDTLPVVVCDVEANQTLITERGSMCWMSPNMKMDTTSNGGIGKALGRMFSGEALFQNKYTAIDGAGMIAFASSFPGTIKAFNITPSNPLIVQKSAFLASEESVELSVHFKKKLGAGFFGGEGFIMQKLSGNGIAFLEIDGHAVEYDLTAGQSMIIDTGYLAAMSATCSMEIQTVPGIKNMVFGGEGVFNTVITGPGHIILQTMPINSVANTLIPYLPSTNKR